MSVATTGGGLATPTEVNAERRNRWRIRPLVQPAPVTPIYRAEDGALVQERVDEQLRQLIAALAFLDLPEDDRRELLRRAMSALSDVDADELMARLLPLGTDYALLARFGDPRQGDAQEALCRLAWVAAQDEIAARVRLYRRAGAR